MSIMLPLLMSRARPVLVRLYKAPRIDCVRGLLSRSEHHDTNELTFRDFLQLLVDLISPVHFRVSDFVVQNGWVRNVGMPVVVVVPQEAAGYDL